MPYSTILSLDYAELHYRQFLYTCAIYKRSPFRAIYYENGEERGTLVVFSRTQSGGTVTRHLRFNRASAEKIAERLENDFKGLSVEVI